MTEHTDSVITVRNAEGEPDTQAQIIIQNKIDYTPKVSVIIPVYNTEEYLRECMDSVINQTLKEIEIICVDDGSTDGSLSILKEYAKKDERITVITQENLHAGVARNAGLAVAKGEYVHFIDSDDWVDLDTYERLYKLILEKEAPILKFRSYTYDNKLKQIVNRYFTNMGAVKESYFERCLFFNNDYETLINVSDAPWSGIYLRNFLTENNILFDNLLCANDTSFFYRCLVNADKIYLSTERFVYYRINNSKSLIGRRAYHFDCQIKQFFIIQKITEKYSFEIIVAVRKHLIHALFYRYTNYIKEQLLDVETKNRIKKDMVCFSSHINENEVPIDYYGYYKDLKYDVQVSIIIPVYNTEEYLRECMDSVVNQTLKNIEIICIDDCSTDGSYRILEEYAARDGRIKLLRNDQNLGAPGAVKNIGIKEAEGEYIGFVDSDDYVDLNYFEELYSLAQNHDSDIAASLKMTYFGKVDSCRIIQCPKKVLVTAQDKQPLIKMSGSNCSKIYRREMIKKNNISCCEVRNVAEDNYFSMLAMVMANCIVTTSKAGYYYRRHDNSVTSHSRTNNDFAIFDIYKSIDEYIVHNIENSTKQQEYMNSINQRKIQDFTWFKADCDLNYLEEFKSRLKSQFPEIYNRVFIPDIIISLTSYPARIDTVHLTIESLLNQSMKADKVILWLAPEQFPNKEADLPRQLLDLRERGLTIDWYHDIKSYKKLIPALKKYPDAIIVTADDDNIYRPDWLKKLYESYLKYPECIHCHRITKFYRDPAGFQVVAGGKDYHKAPSYLNKLVGLGGVLYPPHCFHKDILNEDLIKRLAPTNDDQWFWVQAALNGYKTRVVDNPNIEAHYVTGTQEFGLSNINDKGQKLFWKDFRQLTSYYPEFKDLLIQECNEYAHSYNLKIPYKTELENWYRRVSGNSHFSIDNPQTFNEKIQWLKLYDSTPIKTRLADKYLVRDWVKEKIGEEYLIPLLGVYDDFEEIDFDKLPNQFVIKCNHGSGYNIVVKNKSELDLNETKIKINNWMNENFAFKVGCELHYRDIQPKIVIEEFLDEISESLYDYRFFCFNGKVELIWLDVGSGTPEHKRKIYDKNWNELNIIVKWPKLETNIPKPQNLEKMIKLSEIMSKDFALVRVDFYNVNEKIYFGEMTFTSMSGTGKWSDERYDLKFGQMIALPNLAYNIDTGEYYEWLPQMNNKSNTSSPLLYKDIGLGCNTWCEPRNVSGNAYTYDLSDSIYTRYVSWDPIKEGSCDVEILRLSAVEKRNGRVVEFPVDRIISSGKITGSKVEFRNQKCWIGCAVEGAYESLTVEASVSRV